LTNALCVKWVTDRHVRDRVRRATHVRTSPGSEELETHTHLYLMSEFMYACVTHTCVCHSVCSERFVLIDSATVAIAVTHVR
jgi:hypothetical protein